MPEFTGTLGLPRQNGAPAPVDGRLYFDTDLEKIGFWDGAEWIYLPTPRRGVTLFTGHDPPDDPEPGDVWLGDGFLAEWDDEEDEWIVIGLIQPPPGIIDGGGAGRTGRGIDGGWPDTDFTIPPIGGGP
jgi:hypothetical protein